MKLSFLGRADLVRLMGRRAHDRTTLPEMAGLLGFEPVAQPPDAQPASLPTPPTVEKTVADVEWTEQALVPTPFWHIVAHRSFSTDIDEEPTKPGGRETVFRQPPLLCGLNGELGRRAESRPLASWPTLFPTFRRSATLNSETTEPDIAALVDRLGRGALIRRLPRRSRRRWGEMVQVILDRSQRLTPYWDDSDLVCNGLSRVFARHAFESYVKWDCLPLFHLGGKESGFGYRLPPPQTLVLVLGDLGCMEKGSSEDSSFWLELGQRLRGAGCRRAALIPCSRERFPDELAEWWQMIEWEKRPLSGRGPDDRLVTLEEQAEQLLRLLSPAVRIEPGLLREMRFLLWPEIGAGVEAEVWQDSAVAQRSYPAAVMDSELRKHFLAEFEDEPEDLRARALERIRRWREALPSEIWFHEICGLDRTSRRLLPDRSEEQTALHFLDAMEQELSRHARGTPQSGALAAFAWRMAGRLPDPVFTDSQFGPGLRRVWGLVRKDSGGPPPPGFDPRESPTERAAPRKWRLWQQGNQLQVRPFSPAVAEGQLGSPIGEISSRNDWILIDGAVSSEPDLDLSFWRRDEHPSWAHKWGLDQYGAWVTFRLSGIEQKMRWIPPGRFWMGSPPDEPGRWSDEGPQHEVEISRGFWLFDTAVTQELWREVMGSPLSVGPHDPSRFKGPRRPVEQVSWTDCRHFLSMINRKVPDLRLELPTEAQWEYACRAGTSTPFCFGDDITPEQVNYNGNHPYVGGKKGKYRGETVEVGSLSLNAWGLTEMHGNVREWCLDWFGEYSEEFQVDPQGVALGWKRVVRGGSWFCLARYVRSAYRHANDPGFRSSNLGFRCARVQDGAEPARDRAGREAEPRTAWDRARRVVVRAGESLPSCRIPESATIRARTDVEEIEIGLITRPKWAAAIGRDRYGLWVEFEVEGKSGPNVRQRMRYIPPGRFWMGSPEAEVGRFDNEKLHEVTVTQGFWLFETAVTQALWEAVMGKNSSQFKGAQKPVERVSWIDCRSFFARINHELPALQLELPTEAQWEYACRAGTRSAFSFGEGISAEQVNYDGNYPYAGGKKEMYRVDTVEVGSLPPNGWGLREMHGNVWEWCLDWFGEYVEESRTDPRGPEGGSARVVRGGGWGSVARVVRSASRGAGDPGSRGSNLGFRCARVQDREMVVGSGLASRRIPRSGLDGGLEE